MKNSTVKVSVTSDNKLLSTKMVPAIKGYESVEEVSYNYNSSEDRTSLEIRSNRKIKNPEKLIASMVNYGNPDNSNLQVILVLISNLFKGRKSKRYLVDSYGRTISCGR